MITEKTGGGGGGGPAQTLDSWFVVYNPWIGRAILHGIARAQSVD